MSCYRSQFGLSAFLSPHTRPPLPIPPLSIRHGNSILRQHASQAERHAHPSPACNSVNTGSVHRPFFMAPQVFNLLVPSLSVRSLTSTLWKPCTLSLMELYEYLFPSALPVSLLLHHVCSATVWCSIFRNGSEEGWRGGGVEGKGRGRLPEGSALWLALSNWLMRKASLCSWQAGDSSSWLRWYTYLGLKWWWRWWREGLPSHCKGVKKEIRLLHIMPNEIGPPADAHATMSCEHTHTLPGWIEHTVNGMGEGVCGRAEWQRAWMRDEEHMLEVHVFCLSDIRVWKEHSVSGSMEDNKKMGEKTKKEKKNGTGSLLFWQMMFHLRGFIVLQVPFRFISFLVFAEWPRALWYHRVSHKNTGGLCLSCVLLTNAAWDLWDTFEIQCIWIHGVILCRKYTKLIQFYPKPKLLMWRPKNGQKKKN